jgi:hypothetical protein
VKFGDIKNVFRGQTLAEEAEEIKDVALRYVREETVDPVKALGRYTAFGCAGSFLVGLGGLLVAVGLLRLLQDLFHGTTSWIPYLLVTLGGIAVVGLTLLKISSGPSKRRIPSRKSQS